MASVRDLARTVVAPQAKALDEPRASDPGLYATPAGRGARIANRAARRHSQSYGGEDAIGTVMDCVDLYAQTSSNAAYHFERNSRALRLPGDVKTPETRGQAPDDLVALFARPNRLMDYTELIELSIIDLLLAGEFFWYKHETDAAGQPQELYRISPALVDVEPGKTAVKRYIYHVPGGDDMEVAPAEMVHVKRPNPHDNWRGLGVIAGDPRMYDIALAMVESMAQYYEQGTRLSGVLESERSISPSTLQKLKNQFAALYSGKSNAYKVAALERGLKFKPISGNAGEADYKNLKPLVREDIAQAFKVPLPLLGAVGSADRQAVKEAQRIFDNKIMRPFLNRLQRAVTFQLVNAWDLDYVIDHEYVMPLEDKIDLAQALAAVPGVRVREVRALVDYKPLAADDPDLAWIDEAILNLPGKDREEGGHADRPLASEAGRPPKGGTALFPRDPGDVPRSADIVAPGTPEAAQKAVQEALNGAR